MNHLHLRLVRIAGLFVAASSLGACATITRGTTQPFTIASEPPGARAVTTTGFDCPSTPCTFKMKRKDPFDVTVTKPGYDLQKVHVTRRLKGGLSTFGGNAILGGAIGVGVDFSTGAPYDLSPNPLTVVLLPEGTTPATTDMAPAAAPAAASPATPH